MNDNGRFRKKTGYTAICNTMARDPSLSHKAKGLYTVIMSYITIPNFDITKSFIFKHSIEGEKSFESSWNELKNFGYLKVYFSQANGSFQAEYELLEEPVLGPHTFYLDNKGNIKSTNLDRKKKKENQKKEETKEEVSIPTPIQDPQKKMTESYPQQDRIPQKGGNGKKDDRYPLYGSNANGGNNINLNNKPINNNNNLSIYLEMMDGWTDTTGIPENILAEKNLVELRIKELCEYDYYSQNSDYTPLEQETHNLLIKCLIEMATEQELKTYGSSKVSYKNIIDKINEVCSQGDLQPLHFFIEMTMEDYIKVAGHTEIKNLKGYLKSCLWNSFATYKLKWQSYFERTYNKN